jgi:hypothetical protein
MMKPAMKIFFTFTIILFGRVPMAVSGLVNGDVQIDEKTAKMLAIPAVKTIYDGCKKTAATNMPDCIWTQVQKDKELTKQVLDASRGGAVTTGSTSTATPMLKENFSTDPALQKLHEIIVTKLQEALYGAEASKDNSTPQAMVVDHKKFSDFYRTELNKTMVDAFMSYCLDTVGGNTPITDDKQFKANRDKNIANLKAKDATTYLENGTWNTCLAGVKGVCLDPTIKDLRKDRACLVTQYVDAARKNLSVLDETDKFYDGLGKSAAGAGFQPVVQKSDAIATTVTSKDIDTAFKDATESAKTQMADCLKSNDETKCREFLNTNTDKNKDGEIAFALQQNADAQIYADKVDKIKTPEEMKKFLEEQGYKKEKIDAMDISNKATVDDIKKEITLRYKNEKDALIKEMNDRIEKKTAKSDGKIDAKTTDIGNLTTISNELATRTTDMSNLVMFTNVVSGYLDGTIGTGKDAKSGRNTASMAVELSAASDYNKDVKTNLEAAGTKIALPPDGTTGDKPLAFDLSNTLDPDAVAKKTAK